MRSFESQQFPGSSYLEVVTPTTTVGNVAMSPALKTGVFNALGIRNEGFNLPITSHAYYNVEGATHNRAAQYLATGLYMLAGEKAGVDDPTQYAAERMQADALLATRTDGSAEEVGKQGLYWSAELGSGVDLGLNPNWDTVNMLVSARLVHALAHVNREVGNAPVVTPPRFQETETGSLTVSTSQQGQLLAIETHHDGTKDVFSSKLPTIWGHGVSEFDMGVTSNIAFAAQRQYVGAELTHPLTPGHIAIPLSEALVQRSTVEASAQA